MYRKVGTVIATDVFGSLRCLTPFRLAGGTKGELSYVSSVLYCHLPLDYVIVSSDSGRIAILYYDPKTSSFVESQQETCGKSGTCRIVPGQFLATDPKDEVGHDIGNGERRTSLYPQL